VWAGSRPRRALCWAAVTAQPRSVAVIGAALDLGQRRRGVDMGPSAIRYAGLGDRLRSLGCAVDDHGDVAAAQPGRTGTDDRARHLPQILDACSRVAALVRSALRAGSVPLVLGGDHSVAMGTLSGLAEHHGAPGAVLWIDAHGDLNTPATSPTGNVHGMPLAAALGLAGDAFDGTALTLPAVDTRRTVLVGVRSLDPAEQALVRDTGLRVFTMSEIDRIGIQRALQEALDRVAGSPFVHVSLDLDVLDPEIAPGVGTPVRGGLTYREAHLALELVAESGLAGSLEIVEVNPILDRENTTASVAVELVASGLGQTII
jgi:arginase